MNEAKTEKKINSKSGRLAQHYQCALCLSDFPSKDIEVDHKVPIGVDRTWDQFIDGLFCEKENLQALCKPCHKIKSASEKPPKKVKNESESGNPAPRGASQVRRRTQRKGSKSSD